MPVFLVWQPIGSSTSTVVEGFGMLPPRPKARSVQQCEIYLDLLAAVMRKAGQAEARKLLPLVVRLRAELDAARAEDALLKELLQREPRPIDNQLSEGEADYE